jgi:hypothetical protein
MPDFKKYEKTDELYSSDLFSNANEATSTGKKDKSKKPYASFLSFFFFFPSSILICSNELSFEDHANAIFGERPEKVANIDVEFDKIEGFSYLKVQEEFIARPKEFVDIHGHGEIVYKV